MNCIEARRMVAPFVKKELSDKETEQFLKHIEQCADCMDELDIFYTMQKAFDSLDSGVYKEWDFRKMLDNEIRAARHAIVRRRAARVTRRILVMIAELILLLSVYTGYQMRQGETGQSIVSRTLHMVQSFSNGNDREVSDTDENETGSEMKTDNESDKAEQTAERKSDKAENMTENRDALSEETETKPEQTDTLSEGTETKNKKSEKQAKSSATESVNKKEQSKNTAPETDKVKNIK